MITYWVPATPENAKLLGVNSGWVNKHNMFVVNQIGREIQGIQIVSDYVKQQVLDQGFIPEYKYHEKTKQFIPANSKLFEEQDKQDSIVVEEDFKVEVGGSAVISPDYKDQRYSGKEVIVLATFTYEDEHYVVVAGKLGCMMVEQDQLLPPLSEHEKRVNRFMAQYKPVFQRMKSDLGVTHEDLAEFLLGKLDNQETKQ